MSNNKNKTIRILLADDQELVRVGLRMIFKTESDLELVAVTSNFEETIFFTQKYVPDVILFDCMLREGKCIDRIPELLAACPSSKILILTACQNREKHLFALRSGAIGVFTLNQPIEMLIKAIHKVYAGDVWLSNSLANELLKGFNNSEPTADAKPQPIGSSLTPRELTIARLVAEGVPAKQIAAKLFISEKTVRNQLIIIYSKLGVHNHIELVLHAPRLGVQDSNL
jgi:DNA-binding NarL/FixJ family response regulator